MAYLWELFLHARLLYRIWGWKYHACLINAYDVTIQRYRNSYAKIQESTVYGFKFYVKFQSCVSSNLCEIFQMSILWSGKKWRVMISYSYGILSLSETGPWTTIAERIVSIIHWYFSTVYDTVFYSFPFGNTSRNHTPSHTICSLIFFSLYTLLVTIEHPQKL